MFIDMIKHKSHSLKGTNCIWFKHSLLQQKMDQVRLRSDLVLFKNCTVKKVFESDCKCLDIT